MKRELKVGDKVAVYVGGAIYTIPSRKIATIIDFSRVFNKRQQRDWLRVEYADGTEYSAHRKQCRLIKPKKKPREFWVNVYEKTVCAYLKKEDADRYAGPDRLECILVKEVVGK